MRWRLVVMATVAGVTLPGCGPGSAPDGTLVVLLAGRDAQTASGEVAIHSSTGWHDLHDFSGAVPPAPRTAEAAAASLPSGAYDAMRFGTSTVGLRISVSPGTVEPVLLGLSQGAPQAAEAYAGQAEVNLGLRELGGDYPALPAVTLVDQHGRGVASRSWLGRTTVLATFESGGGGPSPAYLALLRGLRHTLPSARLVEVSSDPGQDTVAALSAYAERGGVTWTLVTGSADAIGSLLGALGAVPAVPGGQPENVVAIVDAHGYVLRRFPGRAPTPTQMLDAVAALDGPLPTGEIDRAEPAFRLTGWNGATLDAGHFVGHPLVINFWASWCQPCRTEMPMLQAAAANDRQIAFLFVDERDDQGSARAFLKSLGITAPVGSDADGSVAAAFDVAGVPSTLFISAAGLIQDVQLGQLDHATLTRDLADIAPG